MDENNTVKHNVNIKNREELEMSGIEEVITFNENKIILKSNLGRLDIKGEKLNIKKLNLDNQEIQISGYVNSFEYTDKPVNKNIFKRLFK